MADKETLKTTLTELLKATDDSISEQKTVLAKAQEDLQRQNEKRTALQSMISELDKCEQAISSQYTAAKNELRDARDIRDSLMLELEKTLDQEMAQKVKDTKDGVDKQIQTLRQQKQDLTANATKAEQAKRTADDEVSDYESRYQRAKTALQQLPTDIATAKNKVAKIKDAARAAAKEGRLKEALWQILEMEQMINDLTAKLDLEPSLADELAAVADELEKKRDDVIDKKRELASRQTELQMAENKLKQAEENREKDIQQKLKELG